MSSDHLKINNNNLGINNSRPSSYNNTSGRESSQPSRTDSDINQILEVEKTQMYKINPTLTMLSEKSEDPEDEKNREYPSFNVNKTGLNISESLDQSGLDASADISRSRETTFGV